MGAAGDFGLLTRQHVPETLVFLKKSEPDISPSANAVYEKPC
jgi:hypothetical protein